MPFIGLLVIFIALLYFFLPETKGRAPCDVQDEFVRMTGGAEDDATLGSYTRSLPSENGDSE